MIEPITLRLNPAHRDAFAKLQRPEALGRDDIFEPMARVPVVFDPAVPAMHRQPVLPENPPFVEYEDSDLDWLEPLGLAEYDEYPVAFVVGGGCGTFTFRPQLQPGSPPLEEQAIPLRGPSPLRDIFLRLPPFFVRGFA